MNPVNPIANRSHHQVVLMPNGTVALAQAQGITQVAPRLDVAALPPVMANKPKWGDAVKASLPRLIDALSLFILSNLLPGIGHLMILPIAAVDGAVAVNEFRKAAGMKPLGKSAATAQFFEKAKQTLDKAKIDAQTWEKPFKGLYKFGLATLAAGVLIHPLLLVGPLLMAVPLIAKDLGITTSVFKQLLAQGAR
jgi:hypothetical protein